jgi:hypothetical protein
MSRYVKQLEDGKEIAYGYDHALGYFFQIFETDEKTGEEMAVMDECSTFTQMTNGRMGELLEAYDCSPEHLDLVMYDLPI